MKILWDNPDFRNDDLQLAFTSLLTHVGAKGYMIPKFEEAFAKKVGAKYAVAVDNGTNALVAVWRPSYGSTKFYFYSFC